VTDTHPHPSRRSLAIANRRRGEASQSAAVPPPARSKAWGLALGSVPFIAGISADAWAECKITRVGELPVSIVNNQPLLEGQVNGQPVGILIDTGSTNSIVFLSEAIRLGLPLTKIPGARMYGAGGATAAQRTTVKELKIADVTGNDVPLQVVPERGAGRASMNLGENFWGQFSVEFDFPHNAIRLFHVDGCKPEQLVYWAPSFSLADLEARPKGEYQLKALVQLNGVHFTALLDTGAAVSTVTLDAAARANVRPDSPGVVAASPIIGFGYGQQKRWVGKFDSFAMGDEQIRNTKLSFGDLFASGTKSYIPTGSHIERSVSIFGADMLVGADFFMSHRVFVPEGERYFVFTYVGGPVFQTVHDSAPPPTTALPGATAQPEGADKKPPP
jgi:predicted aspartyl protease